jgi:type IV secretory pathway TrbF-like protein
VVWQGGSVRPVNPLWYLAAFLFALGSVMIATVVAAGAWDPVREVTVTPTTVRADAQGKTLVVFTDILQPDRNITCRATGRDKKTVDVPPAALDITVDNEGNQWHLIGLLDDGSTGMRVQCTPRDRRVDNASYGWATVTGFESRANNAKGIGVLGLAVAVAFAGYVFYCRRQHRQETTRELA